jgi:hypothetical protein
MCFRGGLKPKDFPWSLSFFRCSFCIGDNDNAFLVGSACQIQGMYLFQDSQRELFWNHFHSRCTGNHSLIIEGLDFCKHISNSAVITDILKVCKGFVLGLLVFEPTF